MDVDQFNYANELTIYIPDNTIILKRFIISEKSNKTQFRLCLFLMLSTKDLSLNNLIKYQDVWEDIYDVDYSDKPFFDYNARGKIIAFNYLIHQHFLMYTNW